MELQQYLKSRKKLVEEAIENFFFQEDSSLSPPIDQAIRYSLFAGGKRLRPILVLASAEAAGGGHQKFILPFACAIELIHTYSLIHDDLPAMDDSNLRRGRPTLHRVFGEAIAILTGDALLTLAFQLMTTSHLVKNTDPSLVLKVINEISRAAGYLGMIGGQAADLEAEKKEINFPHLEAIHHRKTGALILASVKVGGWLGGGTDQQVKSLARYGEKVGLAFQIADDLLDFFGNESELGKETGKDKENKKATYPLFWGVEKSRQKAEDLAKEAAASLKIFGKKAEALNKIAEYIIRREV